MRIHLILLSLLCLVFTGAPAFAQEGDKTKEPETKKEVPTEGEAAPVTPPIVDDLTVPKTSAEAAARREKVKEERGKIADTDETKKDLREAYDKQIAKLTELAKVLLDLENFETELKALQQKKEEVEAEARALPESKPIFVSYRTVTEQMDIEASQLLSQLEQEKLAATTNLNSLRDARQKLAEEIANFTTSVTRMAAAETEATAKLREAEQSGGDVLLREQQLYLAKLDREVQSLRRALAEREQATNRRLLREQVAEVQESIIKRKLAKQQEQRDAIKSALAEKIGRQGKDELMFLKRDRDSRAEGTPFYVYYDFKVKAAEATQLATSIHQKKDDVLLRVAESGDYETLNYDATELRRWIDQEEQGDSSGLLPDTAEEIRTYLAQSQARFAGATRAVSLLREEYGKMRRDANRLKTEKTRLKGRIRVAQEEAKNFKGGESVPTADEWAKLATELEKIYENAEKRIAEVVGMVSGSTAIVGVIEAERKNWNDLKSLADSNIEYLQQRLRWTQGRNEMSWQALQDSFKDGTTAIENSPKLVTGIGPFVAKYWNDPSHRIRVIVVGVIFIALGFLFWRLRKRLPTTYNWIEQQTKEGHQAFKVLGIFLRRTDLSLLTALLFVGAPWAAGMEWEVVGTALCIFATPFLYQLGRVILDVFFQPGSNDIRFFDMDEKLAQIVHRAGRWMLNLALFFLPIGYLLEIHGYDETNPGFVQLWWLVHSSLTQLVLLFSIFRPVVVKTLIRGQNIVAVSLKAWILIGYPLIVCATLFIFILGSLRYYEAKAFFQLILLKTVAVLLGSYILYRIALRALLKGRELGQRLMADEFENEDAFVNAGRQQFFDRLVRTMLRFAFAIPVVLLLVRFWEGVSFDWAQKSIDGAEGVSFGDILQALLVVFITMVAVTKIRGALAYVILPATKLDRGLRYTVTMLLTYGSWTIGMVIALQILKVKGENIAFFTGALAFGIGFGLQSIVKNFVSGLILLIERPVKVGDMVEVESRSGTVDKITLRATTVMTYDGIGVVIPNELMIGGSLTNYSLGHPRLRSTLAVGVAYGSDVQKVRKLLNEVVSNHGLILKRPEPEAFFIGFGDSSLDFQILFWTSMTTHRPRTLSDLRFALNAAFRRENIEIPFPQRDLNVRTVDGTVVAAFGGAKLPEKGDGGALDIDDARNAEAAKKTDGGTSGDKPK